MTISRRDFGRLVALSAGAATVSKLWAEGASPKSSSILRFAAIADTHIIDEFYKGPEGSPEDTESIFHTTERLTSTRNFINGLQPEVEKVFLIGDYFHNYPSTDYDFYFKNKTRIDHAKEITDGFKAPVHIGFGNHDYSVPTVSREFSHKLFMDKLKLRPYYSIDYRGVKFAHLNNFLGMTWDKNSPRFKQSEGSLGEEQLNWFEAELGQQKPTFVFMHFPILSVMSTEVRDYGLLPLLKKHKDNIPLFLTGHLHRWMDFAHTFGPQHYGIASTRYDENAYMLVEYDLKSHTLRFLNSDLVDWATHYSKPYRSMVRG